MGIVKIKNLKKAPPTWDENPSGESFFGRHSDLDPLVEKILSDIPSPINIAFVGIGRDAQKGKTACASGPFELAALLEYMQKDYQMTLIDLSGDSLMAAQNREDIFGSVKVDDPRQYIKHTGFNPLIKKLPDGQEIFEFPIPSSFKTKRETGEIRFIQGDIVSGDFSNLPQHQFVNCLNVLPHLYDDLHDQMPLLDRTSSAIKNLFSNTSQGGIILLEKYYYEALMRNYSDTEVNGSTLKLLETVDIPKNVASRHSHPMAEALSQYAFLKRE